jgi:hypothetical protein
MLIVKANRGAKEERQNAVVGVGRLFQHPPSDWRPAQVGCGVPGKRSPPESSSHVRHH